MILWDGEKDWVKYEEKIRKLYPTRSKRKYKGSDCEGVADGITNVNGKETAIEAKYINKWKFIISHFNYIR